MKLIYFVTEDWYFCSHRLSLAAAAKCAGYDVAVVTRVRNHGRQITEAGVRVIPLELERRGLNPLAEIRLIWQLWGIYRREAPDILHHVAIKPVVHGSIAAWLSDRKHVVNAVAGLGWIFVSTSLTARVVRRFVKAAIRSLLNRGIVIVQNPDDRDFLVAAGVDPARITIIPGSGVDTREFSPRPSPGGPPVVMLASRLLWDKGVGEFVEAARILRDSGVSARFVLVGDSDPANRAAIPPARLAQWQHEGHVELWGHRTDMADVLARSHIVCLPSYREGLPKVLIEAASAGRPIVATDVPGCREIVRHGTNGLLVPVKSVAPLAAALRRLIENPDLRLEMGLRGREIAVTEFSAERINAETLALYAAFFPVHDGQT